MGHRNENPGADGAARGARNALQAGEHSENRRTEERAQAVLIGRMQKNSRESIRVALDEFKGHRYADVRVVVPGDDGQDRPTKAGVTVKLAAIPELIRLLNLAHTEACARGLIQEACT